MNNKIKIITMVVITIIINKNIINNNKEIIIKINLVNLHQKHLINLQ